MYYATTTTMKVNFLQNEGSAGVHTVTQYNTFKNTHPNTSLVVVFLQVISRKEKYEGYTKRALPYIKGPILLPWKSIGVLPLKLMGAEAVPEI